MLKDRSISREFDQAAAHSGTAPLREAFTDIFRDDLDATVTKVADVLRAMGLPLPTEEAIVSGAVGTLIPLDRYGIILRIEQSDSKLAVGQRIDAHPMVLQPLGQRHLTNGAVLEICAGCRMTSREDYSRLLADRLPQTGVEFWDDGVTNIGLLPFATDEYPHGVPVVIDRLAVDRLGGEVADVRQALALFGLKEDLQARYQPLKDAFATAWPEDSAVPDTASFSGFFALCEEFTARGELIAGWAAPAADTDNSFEQNKSRKVADAGQSYTRQMAVKGPAS